MSSHWSKGQNCPSSLHTRMDEQFTWQIMDKVLWLVCWHLCQAHLEEVGLMQISAYHDSQTIIIGCHSYFNILVQW